MFRMSIFIIAISLVLPFSANSEDNPEKLIQASTEALQQEVVSSQNPEQRWQAFLDKEGWAGELSDGGVIIVPDRDLLIASATVFTKVRIGQPGWVESRVIAFENAEMEAKAKIIRFLVESTETQRSITLLENAAWEDGEVDKIRELSGVADTLRRIGKKSLDLTESKLNSALQQLDPEYDPDKYKEKSVEDLKVIAESHFNRRITSIAMKTLIGVTPIYSTEEKLSNDEYQVLVGVIWSPKLNRLALSLFNDEYNIPAVAPSAALDQKVPQENLALLGTMGTRIVIDENGQYVVMAYGQAQPRRTSPSRQQAALHDAKQVAANRARAHIVNFIREGITLRETELSDELSREFSDMTLGTEIVRDYKKKIAGQKVKIKLHGLRILKEWNYQHPITGQEVAGAVVAWSPSSAGMSKEVAQTMKDEKPATVQKPIADSTDNQEKKPQIESMKVDTSAY